MSVQVNMQCLLCLGRSAGRVGLFSSIVEERPKRSPLFVFPESILMVYFVSSIEREIKDMYSLNNTQHCKLINRF